MKIAIDIDDVLGRTFQEVVDYYNRRFGGNANVRFMKDTNMRTLLGISKEDFQKFLDEFYGKRILEGMLPVEDCQRVVELLDQEHELNIITSRSLGIEDQTLNWLNKHFSDKFSEVHHSGNHYFVQDRPTKAELCKQLGINVLIEDDLRYAEESAFRGTKVLLMNAPWNQKEDLHENIIRVKDWNHVLEEINNMQELVTIKDGI